MMGLLVEAFKCKNILVGGCFDEVLVVANFFSKLDLPTDGISAMHWPHVASQLVFFFLQGDQVCGVSAIFSTL